MNQQLHELFTFAFEFEGKESEMLNAMIEGIIEGTFNRKDVIEFLQICLGDIESCYEYALES